MKLVNSKYDLCIEFEENKVNTLVIENPTFMRDVVENIALQAHGEIGDFVLSDGEKELKITDALELVVDPFSLDFNNRKMIGQLYKSLTDQAAGYTEDWENINASIIRLLDRFSNATPYSDIAYDLNLDWNTLFKMYNVSVNAEGISLPERLIEYIKIVSNLCNTKILCFVNLKKFLNYREQQQLFEMALYCKIQLLLIEADGECQACNEKVVVIDKDRCIIEL